MPIKFGTTSISSIYKGDTKIDKIYKGLNLVYQSSLLPSGYIECEYLESTGTQYLNLGYYPNNNTKVETTVNILSHNGNVLNYLFGAYDSARSFAIYYSYNLRDWGVMCGSVDRNTSVAYQLNTKQKLEFDKNNLSINGTSVYAVGSTTTFTSTKTMYLFWGNGTSRLNSISRIYDFKIYENGNIVMNLIPALDSNGVPCMYDTVSKQTFYNRGTGEFSYRVKLPDGYTLCEYLESTGTQYIDTGYYATNTSGINIDYAYTKSGNAGLCGIYQPTVPRTDALFVTTLSGQTSTEIYLISQGGEATNYVVPVLETKYNGKINYLNNGKLIIDNVTKGNNGHNGVVSSRTIKLFCRDYNGNLAYTNARIYMCKISEGEIVVRNLIPCLDDNNVPCMYDSVSKTTFYNAGSGTFNYE